MVLTFIAGALSSQIIWRSDGGEYGEYGKNGEYGPASRLVEDGLAPSPPVYDYGDGPGFAPPPPVPDGGQLPPPGEDQQSPRTDVGDMVIAPDIGSIDAHLQAVSQRTKRSVRSGDGTQLAARQRQLLQDNIPFKTKLPWWDEEGPSPESMFASMSGYRETE